MNIQNTDSYKYRKLIGQIKFSFIAPVVSRTFIDDSISAYFKRVSETEIDWPDGTKRRFSDKIGDKNGGSYGDSTSDSGRYSCPQSTFAGNLTGPS